VGCDASRSNHTLHGKSELTALRTLTLRLPYVVLPPLLLPPSHRSWASQMCQLLDPAQLLSGSASTSSEALRYLDSPLAPKLRS